MVQLNTVQIITTSGTLSYNDDTYIVNASGGNITITLPNITTDGISYLIKRSDNTSNIVTVECTGGQTINGTPSITIYAERSVELIAKTLIWYAAFRTNPPGVNKPIYTIGFRQNNSKAFIDTQNAVFELATAFSYAGSGTFGIPISSVSFIVGTPAPTGGGSGSGTASGEARLINQADSSVIASVSWGPILEGTVERISTNTISNVPINTTVLRIEYRKTAGNKSVQLYSFVMR